MTLEHDCEYLTVDQYQKRNERWSKIIIMLDATKK